MPECPWGPGFRGMPAGDWSPTAAKTGVARHLLGGIQVYAPFLGSGPRAPLGRRHLHSAPGPKGMLG